MLQRIKYMKSSDVRKCKVNNKSLLDQSKYRKEERERLVFE